MAGLDRYIACARHSKRPIFCFVSKDVTPDAALQLFLFEDDYSFGVLNSEAHAAWFFAKCSKLKSDNRYTRRSVWDTFPWPQSPSAASVSAVASAALDVQRVRREALEHVRGGLRALYRTLEQPGRSPLKDAHAALDAAVLSAYAFSPKKDLLQQLLDLNRAVAAAESASEPVTPPGPASA